MIARQSRADAGFTLAEIVAVVVVLGIVATVAAPTLRPVQERSVAAAVDALRDVYADARGTAAKRGIPVRVVLETASDSFAVFAEPEGGPRELVRTGRLPLPEDGTVLGGRGGRAHARFTPLGRARADRVVLADGAARRAVEVDPWTGAPRDAAP